MDIGTHLRECRERRGITLHQITASTKLSSTTLQLIERNAFDRLPGGIFTKAYLRAYAAEVGMDPEEVVDEYLAQFPGATATEELSIVPAPARETAYPGRHVLMVVVAIMVALVAYSWLHDSAESPVPSSMELIQAPGPVESLETEIAVAGALPASEPDEQGLDLDIQPTGACWVSAKADGRLVLYRLIHSGERVTVIARDELLLRVGDPEAFAYTLNGVLGRPLGEAGKPVTVQITESNYQTFLAGSAPEARRAVSGSVM
jgi:cytoskeleton protein RodZ